MALLTPEAAKTLAQELHDYSLADEAAKTVAHIVGAVATYSRRLALHNHASLQAPFGYSVLIAEAERLRDRNR